MPRGPQAERRAHDNIGDAHGFQIGRLLGRFVPAENVSPGLTSALTCSSML